MCPFKMLFLGDNAFMKYGKKLRKIPSKDKSVLVHSTFFALTKKDFIVHSLVGIEKMVKNNVWETTAGIEVNSEGIIMTI